MVATLANFRVMILTDQNERRQENCLERYEESQKREGKRIDMLDTGKKIERNPPAETDNVNPNKCHTAAEPGNHPRNAV